MNKGKRRNLFKRVIVFALMLSFVLGQYTPAQAASKKAKDTITLNKTVYTIKKGKSVKLKAALNKSARKKGVEWKSSNPKIASVSKNGKVTAKKNGKTTITASIKGTNVKARSRITVGTPVSKVTLSKKSVSLKTGQKFTLKTTISTRKASNKKAVYESSNSKVATVSKKGVIRAVSAGTAKIRVTAADGSGKKASCTVTVTESTVPVVRVTLNKTQLSLKQGGEENLTATVHPSNAADKTIRWASSNQAVARVSGNGTVRAVAEGTATITASAHNNVRAVCSVKVESTSGQPTEPGTGKILAAYFSWSGTSERIANNIIEQTGADSFRIERETPYSDDYNEVAYGEAKDEADNNARPPIKNPPASVEQYDRIILCYPIWWHTAPMTVGTFLESYDFSGKHIYPVSQSASMDTSQYAQSVEFIKTCAPGAVVDDGIFSKDNDAIRSYIADMVMRPDIIPVTSVTLNQSQLNLKPDEEETLIATVNPSNATNKAVRWSSSDQSVARVSDNGTVKAVTEGIATITASAENDIRAVCTVTVEAASEQPEEPEKPEEPGSGKILAAYFSWSGTSERIANNIIEQTGADSFRIERETPYSDNYNEVAYGEAKDEADNNARPPIKDPLASVEQYDRIVLCYPIWWHTAPMTVGTFLESYDFSGKHIYPVSQSASMDTTQYAQSVEFIKTCAPGAVVDDGIFSKDIALISSYITDTVMQPNPSSASNITSFADVPLLTLNNGVQIPQLGLGTQIQRLEGDSSESGSD